MRNKGRNNEILPLKQAIDDFLRTFRLKPKFDEAHLIASWEKIMGKTIATRTEKIYVSSGVLFLKISSAPLRQELVFARSKLISLINQEMGEELVDEVVFI